MQAIVEMILGLIVLLAAMTLAPLGIEIRTDRTTEPAEVSRVPDCQDASAPHPLTSVPGDC